MRLKTSFFNAGLFRKNMLRFWPIWAAYASIWLLGFGGVWSTMTRYTRLENLADLVAGAGWIMGILMGCTFGLVSAMCVFSYLHSAKSAYFFHALPMDRLELFGTSLISGLAFVMIPNLLFYVLGTVWCSVFTIATFGESLKILTVWLLELSAQYLFYYGASVFCALLTGHILVMPCLYAAMNFVVPVGETLLRGLCQQLVWGFEYGTNQLHWLSPLYHEMAGYGGTPDMMQNGVLTFQVDGYHMLLGLAGAALIFLAWQLYKRRQLEAAGDVIAVSWLRPVFKYGVGLYGAMPAGMLIFLILFQDSGDYIQGLAPFLALCFCMVLGGLICYFAAAMLLEKSFKVLKKHGHGFLAMAAVLLVILTGLRVDVLGLEIWTPDPEDVSGVRVWGTGGSINSSDPAVIRQVIAAHELLLEHKAELVNAGYGYQYRNYDVLLVNGTPTMIPRDSSMNHDSIIVHPAYPEDVIAQNVTIEAAYDKEVYTESIVTASNTTVRIRYTMKSGYRVDRSYRVPITEENKHDTLRSTLADLGDAQLAENMGLDWPFQRVDSMTLEFNVAYDLMDKKLVDSNADRQMVMNAILADYAAGNFRGTQNPLIADRDYYKNYTGWRLEYQLVREMFKGAGSDESYEDTYYCSLNLPRSAVHTLSALRTLGVLTEADCLVVTD